MIDPDFIALIILVIVLFGWASYSEIKNNEIHNECQRKKTDRL